ncbi:hypothetical protein KEM55_003843 [Ascosphaera atra]|nr:hypothetical protein KEM55_003843 [Ascosphaera atra]
MEDLARLASRGTVSRSRKPLISKEWRVYQTLTKMMAKLFMAHSFGSHDNSESSPPATLATAPSGPVPAKSMGLNRFRRHGSKERGSRSTSPVRPVSPCELSTLFRVPSGPSFYWRKKKAKPHDMLLAACVNGPILLQIIEAMKNPALRSGLCFDSVLRAGILLIVTSPDGNTMLGKCDLEDQ